MKANIFYTFYIGVSNIGDTKCKCKLFTWFALKLNFELVWRSCSQLWQVTVPGQDNALVYTVFSCKPVEQ